MTNQEIQNTLSKSMTMLFTELNDRIGELQSTAMQDNLNTVISRAQDITTLATIMLVIESDSSQEI